MKSSSIESVGYDPATEVLEIAFHQTGRYRYFAVPESVYTDFMLARSKGEFFNHYIKDQFACERVSRGAGR